MPFDQPLSMKVLLLIVAAFAIAAWGFYRLFEGPYVFKDDLGKVDMNNERRKAMIDEEAKRWE